MKDQKPKFPKTVKICGHTYTVLLDKTRADGTGSPSDKVIVVGTANPREAREIFIHEVIESILFERGHRYASYSEGNDGLRFVMDHHEFENICKDVLAAFPHII